MRVGGRKIMLNMAVMCCVSLLLRFTGLSFHVWLSNRMGAQGMGLYQLICFAYALAVTLAVSGIRTAVIRLVSEERSLRKSGGALKSCVYHALFFGILSAALLYSGALLSVLIVLFLLPRYAIRAYTGMIWFTECFNFALSIRRLRKVLPKSGAGGIIRCNNRSPTV